MADKPYINLDDDLIDDYAGSANMAPPTPPTSPNNQSHSEATASNARVSASSNNDGQASDLSVALEQEMQDIEKQMYAVAVEGFNRKREQAHQDIDKLYDEMIAVAEDKLRGITVAIAEEVGE